MNQSVVVAFQGEHGAFSGEAIRQHFGPDVETLPCRSFEDIFAAVDEGRATFGAVPVENSVAGSINKAYDRTGSLFQQRFGRIEVTSDAHLLRLIAYIHQNPQKHGFVDDFREWPYSSYHTILSQKDTRLKRDEVLTWFGEGAQVDARKQFIEFHEQEVDEARIAPLVADDFD